MFVADIAGGMSITELTPCDATADFSTLAASGITVHAFDAHGHGQSEPSAQKDRAFVKRFSNYVCHSQRVHRSLYTKRA
jgi:alpha-beta hydrolase superfamily lysophospholipase